MVDKKAVIIVTIISLVIVGLLMYMGLHGKDSENTVTETVQNNTSITNTINEILTDNEKNVENTTENTEENTEKENISEQENKTENETTDENKASSNSEQEKKENPEDIAISLVKKKWGEKDDSVYYYVEDKIAENVYLVSVRSSETTEDLGEYKVNIKSKKVEKN